VFYFVIFFELCKKFLKCVDKTGGTVYYTTNTVVRRCVVEFNSRIPIYLQVIDDIKRRLVTGKISPGSKLPSTRELAVEYNINPNTAARIYREMEQMSLCYTKRGLGTFTTENEKMIKLIKVEMANLVVENFKEEMSKLGYTQQQMIEEIKRR
jgi:DNA-binding transcriptional regulator YhcF (GntR family)